MGQARVTRLQHRINTGAQDVARPLFARLFDGKTFAGEFVDEPQFLPEQPISKTKTWLPFRGRGHYEHLTLNIAAKKGRSRDRP